MYLEKGYLKVDGHYVSRFVKVENGLKYSRLVKKSEQFLDTDTILTTGKEPKFNSPIFNGDNQDRQYLGMD